MPDEGKSGTNFIYDVLKSKSRVELYINGKPEDNVALFHRLKALAPEVESAFGEPLDWDFKEGRGAQRVAAHLDAGMDVGEAGWPELHDRLVATMTRFRNALQPSINRIQRPG